jgi:hypothetical protein
MHLGAEGSTKVQAQLQDLRAMGLVDEEGFDQLHAVMLGGHDGAHPHLPSVSSERASVLLELMKDILYQLFVRKAKIQEAAALRKRHRRVKGKSVLFGCKQFQTARLS